MSAVFRFNERGEEETQATKFESWALSNVHRVSISGGRESHVVLRIVIRLVLVGLVCAIPFDKTCACREERNLSIDVQAGLAFLCVNFFFPGIVMFEDPV